MTGSDAAVSPIVGSRALVNRRHGAECSACEAWIARVARAGSVSL
jgi:hypothetical protein